MTEPPLVDADLAWEVLGIAPTHDQAVIRRAYANRLKAIDPDGDPQAFISLREARDLAMYLSWSAAVAQGGAADGEPPRQADPEPVPAREPEVNAVVQTGRDDEPEIDSELFAAIERLLFGSEATPDWDALHQAATALFASAGLDRIGAEESVQNWAIHTIVNSSPRSDAMLDPAIARFRWADDLTDWRRPPVLDWLLQRRADAAFEHALLREFPRYEEVLRALRTPGAPPPADPSWRFTDDVRAFLDFARQNHPTSIALCDPDALAWWDAYLLRPPTFLRREIAPIARAWNGRNGPNGLFQPRRRPIASGLQLGLLVAPFIFAWAFFRPGHSWILRLVAMGWLGLYVTAIILAPRQPSAELQSPRQAASFSTDPAVDLNPILSRETEGQIDLLMLESQNPPLYDELVDLWRVETAPGGDASRLEAQVTSLLDSAQREGIRNADSLIQEDYWRLRLGQLVWLRDNLGAARCVGFHLGEVRETILFPAGMRGRAREIRTRILRAAGEASPRARAIDLPGPVLEEVRRHTLLPRREIDNALAGRSTAAKRCDVLIILIETALALPQEASQRLLGDLSTLE